MPVSRITVRDLRRWWKPHKERLQSRDPEHPTNIRFHRACSWLARAEQLSNDDLDWALLSQWIAFNALYGQWDELQKEPVADQECWSHFLERMIHLDGGHKIDGVLIEHKALVMSIFEDEFLSRHFWQEPTDKRAQQSRKAMYDARTWFLEGAWLRILDCLFKRIYFLRCQLVHGAASYQGALNRNAIRHCSWAMDHMLKAFLQVWIEYGADENWGILCYPPLRAGAGKSQTAGRKNGFVRPVKFTPR